MPKSKCMFYHYADNCNFERLINASWSWVYRPKGKLIIASAPSKNTQQHF